MSRSCPRVISPEPTRSTLTTSAPIHASNCVHVGPDCTCVKSRMRTPSNALPINSPLRHSCHPEPSEVSPERPLKSVGAAVDFHASNLLLWRMRSLVAALLGMTQPFPIAAMLRIWLLDVCVISSLPSD